MWGPRFKLKDVYQCLGRKHLVRIRVTIAPWMACGMSYDWCVIVGTWLMVWVQLVCRLAHAMHATVSTAVSNDLGNVTCVQFILMCSPWYLPMYVWMPVHLDVESTSTTTRWPHGNNVKLLNACVVTTDVAPPRGTCFIFTPSSVYLKYNSAMAIWYKVFNLLIYKSLQSNFGVVPICTCVMFSPQPILCLYKYYIRPIYHVSIAAPPIIYAPTIACSSTSPNHDFQTPTTHRQHIISNPTLHPPPVPHQPTCACAHPTRTDPISIYIYIYL